MRLLGPTRFHRLNEAVAVVYVCFSVCFTLSLLSYHPTDPSWNSATGVLRPQNLIGRAGSYGSDLCFQIFGLAAFVLPVFVLAIAYHWFRSRPIETPIIRTIGAVIVIAGSCSLLALGPWTHIFHNAVPIGGLIGLLISEDLVANFNTTGAVLVTLAALILALYLVSTFSMAVFIGPLAAMQSYAERFAAWRAERQRRSAAKAREKKAKQKEKLAAAKAAVANAELSLEPAQSEPDAAPPVVEPEVEPYRTSVVDTPASYRPLPSWMTESSSDAAEQQDDDIPIRVLEEVQPSRAEMAPWEDVAAAPARPLSTRTVAYSAPRQQPLHQNFSLPPTTLLNEPSAKNPYDSQELKETAAGIKSKFEEFNVLGNVTQINPGPVVTTFEFKPEAGIKLSRITTLSEDLCLGLQAESVRIDRIPGKPTVGIEVPNTKSEVISLRQILESDEFLGSASGLTIALGKDINGRIKVTAMETMPHLLIAGSTGSGKSVMLNSMIMSILYKSTPNEVRMIMIDPKRVELGMYEGIPHLLTPVITDPRKATNALRNAVLEMERRLKLLASKGVRNIDQYNKKMIQLAQEPPRTELDGTPEDLTPLPFILIIIDELADLMMLERAGVEECVTRLAQMARAVGMHVVLATQRPSVDVITGLIKANFPARISFRVATRVDSRTILDSMGAEHLLGKGDMLFLPPGSSRQIRVHGAYVSEHETVRVVDYWKQQAQPDYDNRFLVAPPSEEDGEGVEGEDGDVPAEDPMYQDAVRIVCEMGKASTSTLQRRLRLGYGRAARILDMMQRDGIIGPPDGSRPREVLKRPDWLDEVSEQYR